MSGTDHRRPLLAEGPTIVLVEPQLGENIGMVARAMANFGLVDLLIVNPRDGWPNEKAVSAASKADHVIERAQIFGTLEEALMGFHFVLATTARQRDMLKPVHGPQKAASELRQRHLRGEKTAILFGRERWGLNNDEITLADEIVTFPVNPAFASLNIAQAVLLMSYEWMKTRAPEEDNLPIEAADDDLADKQDTIGLFNHLESALDDANYFYPPDKREKKLHNMRNLLADMRLKRSQIHVLRGMVAALERRWLKKTGGANETMD